MGTLIAKKYPTPLFLKLADHTYVECGTGARAWSCWGGKTGGTAFHQGTGSTIRANAIADQNERAGITCYLINGVCHQAANRILYPAGILVTGAKGYGVSEALYGPYGRPRGFLGFCKAPFRKHNQLSGDLEECIDSELGMPGSSMGISSDDGLYIAKVAELYSRQEFQVSMDDGNQTPKEVQNKAEEFQLALFDMMMNYRLGSEFAEGQVAKLMTDHRLTTEGRVFTVEQSFAEGDLDVDAFVEQVNGEIINFQLEAANTLSEQEYKQLFDLPRSEQINLGDLDIARAAYSELDDELKNDQ